MTAIDPAPADLQRARTAFRHARHLLAAAVREGDDSATVAAAWRVLRTHDRLQLLSLRPSRRQVRTMRRWRRFALAAIRFDPPSAGLLARIRNLIQHNGPQA